MFLKLPFAISFSVFIYIYIYIYTTLTLLDISVQIAQNKIFTTLHKKTTDNHNYLHSTSCHTVHIKDSINYSQCLRYKRICTRNTDFIEHSKELTTHLLHKAYPINVIIKQWNEVTKIPRTKLFEQENQTSKNCLPHVQTYHPTIVPTNKAAIKELKRCCNMPPPYTCSAAQLSAYIDNM